MEIDLLIPFDMFLLRHHGLINVVLLGNALCYLLIWLKLYFVQDGRLRIALLRFFGAFGAACGLCVFLYHPVYNTWVMPVRETVNFIALLHLTMYIIRDFGIGGRKQ